MATGVAVTKRGHFDDAVLWLKFVSVVDWLLACLLACWWVDVV